MQKWLFKSIKLLTLVIFIFGTFSLCIAHTTTEPVEQTIAISALDTNDNHCCGGKKLSEKRTLLNKTRISQLHNEKTEKLPLAILPQRLIPSVRLSEWPGPQREQYHSLKTQQQLSMVMRS